VSPSSPEKNPSNGENPSSPESATRARRAGVPVLRRLLGRSPRDLEQESRLLDQIAARLEVALAANDPGRSGPGGASGDPDVTRAEVIERQLEEVLEGFARASRLEVRVAELEVELGCLHRSEAIERAAAGNRAAPLERARRLTESSFVAGSDALVRVRAVKRALEEWRQRAGDGASAAPAPEPVADVLASVLEDLARLGGCAAGLRALAGAAEAASWLGGAPGNRPAPAPVAAGPLLLLIALKLRGLAAELEKGLLGLRAELRALRAAGLARPAANGRRGEPPRDRRGAEGPGWGRALVRLEAQMAEVAEHVAAFTRDSEQLARELDRLR
jgi:hypothetical protein